MSTPTHAYRHSFTGKIQQLTEDAASVFPEYLERVAEDAKPFEPGLFKPGKVGEFVNDEPLTDAQLAAESELEVVLETNAPNSKVAREAKAHVEEADAAAQKPTEDAETEIDPEGAPE